MSLNVDQTKFTRKFFLIPKFYFIIFWTWITNYENKENNKKHGKIVKETSVGDQIDPCKQSNIREQNKKSKKAIQS